LDVDVNEIDRDSLLQFFALYLLDSFIPLGIVESKHRLLTGKEMKLVKECQAKGLMSFEDWELGMALEYAEGVLSTNDPMFRVNRTAMWKKLGEVA
jgi:hypothetical protein